MADETQEGSAEQRFRDMISSSGDLIGAVSGGAIGLIGGPVGAMGGAAAGVMITKTMRRVGLEVYDRLIVRRQQERVGAVLAVAWADAAADSEAGHKLRSDAFFDSAHGLRSDADEIFEGLLLHAANAYQERKLRHLGAILPALAVRPEISAADGHWLTLLADRLTWQQFVILSVFYDPPEERFRARDVDHEEGGTGGQVGSIRDEVEELGFLGLLGVTNSSGEIVRQAARWARWRRSGVPQLASGSSRARAGCSSRSRDLMPLPRPIRRPCSTSSSCSARVRPQQAPGEVLRSKTGPAS